MQRKEFKLTPAEAQVLRLATQSLLDKEIADRLGRSVSVVKFHLKNCYRKLGLKHGRRDFMRYTVTVVERDVFRELVGCAR